MYSTHLVNKRYLAEVIIIASGRTIKTSAVIDTGAMRSNINRDVIAGLKKLHYTGNKFQMSGIDVTSSLTFEELNAESIFVGDIEIKNCKLLATSDSRMVHCLLGVDILSQLDFSHSGYNKLLALRKAEPKVIPGPRITEKDTYAMLRAILSKRNSIELIEQVKSFMPSIIDMSLTEFSILIDSILREIHYK